MEYDWKNLTAPLPDDIRMLKENGSWDRELAAIDKRLERELPEALRQRLLIEKEITARLRLEYTYSWEDAVRLMSEELTQFDPSELEYYQNEGTADWHFVDGKVYFQKRFFRTLLKTKPEIRGKWKHLEADPVDDQEQKMLMEIIREMQEKGEAAYRIHARCTLRVEDEAFRPGETLKVHLPLPALAQQVPEVKLLKITPEPTAVPSDVPSRPHFRSRNHWRASHLAMSGNNNAACSSPTRKSPGNIHGYTPHPGSPRSPPYAKPAPSV